MKKFILALSVLSLIIGCSSSDEGGETTTTSYDRSALLKNLADNVILPSYKEFQSKLTILKTSTATFTTTPNQSNLDKIRTDWLTAYKAWQKVEVFNIGKAEELQYAFYMNVYPANATTIEDNIASGTYKLDNINLQTAQGFPALDYLLNGFSNSDVAIISKYTGTSGTKCKKYLTDVVVRMDDLTTKVVTDWESGYKDTFVNNTANSATGSVSKITNDFVYYYEKGLRTNKIGIPAGVFSGGTLFPDKVEAYYKNDVSKTLVLEAFNTIKTVFKGGSGYGYEEALTALNRGDLNTNINAKLAIAETALKSLNDSFSQQISNDNVKMTKAFDALQDVVKLLKVDMTSALSISIDYVDADGD